MFPEWNPPGKQIVVVLPICLRDWNLMVENLKWQEEIDGRKNYLCVLSVDQEVPREIVSQLEIYAWRTFSSVTVYTYPKAPNPAWPNGPNWAFQHTARHMEFHGKSWFWMEADCIPLRPKWLDDLNSEYYRARLAIMGVIVPGMGHCNGTAIYPPQFPKLSKAAMNCTDIAWDGLMKKETIKMTHDVPWLMCHVWGIKHGKAVPHGGEPVVFNSWKQVEKWVDLRAAVFHRCKNATLIERLRERNQ